MFVMPSAKTIGLTLLPSLLIKDQAYQSDASQFPTEAEAIQSTDSPYLLEEEVNSAEG